MAEPVYGVVGETLLTIPVYTLVPSANAGKWNCVRTDDGRVLSVQPDGKQELRPAGTDQAFEQCEVDGNTLIFAYAFGGQHFLHVVAWHGFSGTFV